MPHRRHRVGEKRRSLYLWHRYAGLVAALLVAWLAVTGVVLNHTEDLDLSNRFVRQSWLLSLYGIEPAGPIRGQRIGAHWLAESSGRVYLDGRFIGSGAAIGAAATDFGFIIAFADRLQLYTPDSVLVEELPFAASAAPISGMTATENGVVIVAGGERFLADADFVTIAPLTDAVESPPPVLQSLPGNLAQEISTDVLHHSLTWERVLLDVHAGRIFGKAGVWLADIAGLLLLLLAASGVIVWMQRRGGRNSRR
jgi:hypothetical protein